jgi:hypothetical protein
LDRDRHTNPLGREEYVPDESRDAYRLGQLERTVESQTRRLDALEAWRLLRDEEETRRERERDDSQRKAERKSNAAITGLISLAVAIASALAVALISTGHL